MSIWYHEVYGVPIPYTATDPGVQRYFETDNRIVARTVLPDGKIVSTVFLGLAHSASILYETLVFSEDPSTMEIDGSRYATRREAYRSHKQFVEYYG